jgi:methylated-DNA-[protein]-cysteine S-methyltransferase
MLKIPYGEVRSYRWIADRLKVGPAARAVGNACGKNPLPIVVPCHRVVRHDGSLGGYTGGMEIKRKLLTIEGFLNHINDIE